MIRLNIWWKYAAQNLFLNRSQSISRHNLRNREEADNPFYEFSFFTERAHSIFKIELLTKAHEWTEHCTNRIFKKGSMNDSVGIMSLVFITHLCVSSNKNHHLIWIFPKWFGINEVNRPKIFGFSLASRPFLTTEVEKIEFCVLCVACRRHGVHIMCVVWHRQLSAQLSSHMNRSNRKDRIHFSFYSPRRSRCPLSPRRYFALRTIDDAFTSMWQTQAPFRFNSLQPPHSGTRP